MTLLLGPLPCARCRKVVFWDRVGPELRLLERHPKTMRQHVCLGAQSADKPHRHVWRGGRKCHICGLTAGRLARRQANWYAGQRALAERAKSLPGWPKQ